MILAASTPNAISVHPSVPAKSLQELIKVGKIRPLAEFAAFIKAEVPKQAQAVRDSGAKVE